MVHSIDRRRALQLFAATSLAFTGYAFGSDQHLTKKSMPGEEAIHTLKVGNSRFVSGHPHCGNQDVVRRGELSKPQHPFVTILGCSDSWLSSERIFDQGLGDILTVRVAGNVVGDDIAMGIE